MADEEDARIRAEAEKAAKQEAEEAAAEAAREAERNAERALLAEPEPEASPTVPCPITTS